MKQHALIENKWKKKEEKKENYGRENLTLTLFTYLGEFVLIM